MKKLTRKLFISVLVAVFAFVALGTSTYAWITLSNNAEVNAFEAKVEAGEAGIELSENYKAPDSTLTGDALAAAKQTAIEAATWKTSLTLSKDFTTTLLNDLTMDFTNDGMTFSDYVAQYDETSGKNSMVKTTANVVANEDYIEFSIWMKRTNSTNDSGTTTVKVNGAKVVFETVGDPEATFTYAGNTAQNLLAINAARLSITGNTGTDYKAKTVIYEQKVDDKVDAELRNTAGWDIATGFAHKYAASQDIEIGTEVPKYEAKQSENSANDSGNIITLTGNDPVEIKVRVWIEGWDNECHAQILTQSFKVAFGFEIANN